MRGGPAGDLYIFIEVAARLLPARRHGPLLPGARVDDPRRAGRRIEVPTIDGGRSRVKVPEGSQSGRQMRLRGKGMPALRGTGMGDMYIELAVETPVKLTPEQKDLLREFEESCAKSNNPGGRRAQVRPISQAAITAMFRISLAVDTFDAI
jgi:molecular chaperone DnaJ